MDTHPYVKLAVQAVHHFLSEGKPMPCPSPVPDGMNDQSGVYESIKKKKSNELRGSIGPDPPNQNKLAEEIIQNAVNAATRDPRFKPITIEELDQLLFSVDILTPLEPVNEPEQLNPKQHGLSITYEGRQGILLPNLEGIDTIEKQIDLCLKKGNIPKDAPFQMYRFEVERYH